MGQGSGAPSSGQPSGQSFGDLQQQAASGYGQFTAPPNSQTGITPYTQGVINNFESNVRPQIEAQAALTGTAGSPALTDSLSAGYYSQLPAVLEQQQQGQLGGLQGLSNLAGTTSQHGLGLAGLQNQATQNASNFTLGQGQLYNQFNQTELQRQQQAFNNMMMAGQVDQNYRQSPLDASYNDMLRRMGFAQWAATGGMQSPTGSSSTTVQRGGK